MNIKKVIEDFEEKYGYKIVYITQYGSKLFGTDNPESDTDYKGVFIPTKRDILLKKDIEHYTLNTNESNTKNSKEDVDLQLFSIYKWFTLLKKGETGAIDLLFSLFREETQIYNDKDFTQLMMKNYQRFYNKNLHSFVGYCVGQSKMYNIKGERFSELYTLVERFSTFLEAHADEKLETLFPELEEIFTKQNYKYIRFTMAPTSRGSGEAKEDTYVEVLGKKFYKTVTVGYFFEKISYMEQQFGNRSRASAEGVDFKALSHAVRVICEVEELIDENFITFPLKNSTYVKSIKEGNESLADVMEFLDKKLTVVQEKLEQSDLPLKSDELFMDELLLSLLE